MTFLASLWILVLLNTIFITPKFKVSVMPQIVDVIVSEDPKALDTKSNGVYTIDDMEKKDNAYTNKAMEYDSNPTKNGIHANGIHAEIKKDTKTAPGLPTLKDCMLTTFYLIHIGWFCAIYIRVQAFYGSFNAWVSDIVDHDTSRGR